MRARSNQDRALIVYPYNLKPYPFHLVLRQPLCRPVIELRRPGTLMAGHFLSVLQRTAICEIGSDAGGSETMIPDRRSDADGERTLTDDAPGVRLRHGMLGQRRCRVPA